MKKLLSRSKTMLATLSLVAMAGGAQADVVQIKGYTANGINYSDFVVAPTVYTGVAALWNVTNLDTNRSFLAYCLELLESADQVNPRTYDPSVYTPTAEVRELYDRYYGTVQQSRARAVGFQLALWQLTGQADTSAFQAPSDAVAQANLLLDGVANGTTPYNPNQYVYRRWTSTGFQDVLEVADATNAVPEPQTAALFLGGLGLMALGMAKRRRNGDKSA